MRLTIAYAACTFEALREALREISKKEVGLEVSARKSSLRWSRRRRRRTFRLRPLDATGVRLTGGLLGDRQRVNRDVTILRGHEELERAGTLDNFRIAPGGSQGERRGMVFSDSDVYKWLEALAWELGRGDSAELERLAAETIELVEAAQEPDGYLNTWCRIIDPAWRWTDLEQGHELYCAGHLIQAAIAFARATGETRLLDVARRFADLIDNDFRDGRADRDRRPPGDRAGARRARATHRRGSLPRARRHACRPSRPAPVHASVRLPLLPGRGAGARIARDRRPRRPRALPRERRHRSLRRDRRRGAARGDARAVGRSHARRRRT